ncbi:MBL fold metallo-hydrolase [Azospirillum halopraeferens]|uniref:MBL fold metallo-hydrolase n=1 Tax=Azospirillum halopraeferens TaxID=34010 RepID=UPI000409F34C|nr:MBL fold metallo-hydrolase [Azospirillum halopraeferens]
MARSVVSPFRRLAGLLPVLAAVLLAPVARADCLPIAGIPGLFMPAALTAAEAPGAGTVRVTFLGHASFLIETPGGVSAVTDYNDRFRPSATPDVATMNNAHVTHYSVAPDPGIAHVLRGWDPAGGMAQHDIDVKDLRVRNVPTNVRDVGGTRVAGNSIFVFEAAGLCIAHLGHLHHDLTDLHLNELGLIDVLLVPVDGSFTAAQETVRRAIDRIRPAVVVPMHWFSEQRLARFLEMMRPEYEVVVRDSPTVQFSRATLPRRTVMVLPGNH